MPSFSTEERRVSWLEMTSGTSMFISLERQRQSMSAKQWSSLLTSRTVLSGRPLSRIVQLALMPIAIGAKDVRTDSSVTPSGTSNANRAKNQPLISSVYWLTSTKFPRSPATKPVIVDSKPTRSGQSIVISKVAAMKERLGAEAQKARRFESTGSPGDRVFQNGPIRVWYPRDRPREGC